MIGGDAAETGAGPGSYDIRKSVWHVNVSFHHFKPPKREVGSLEFGHFLDPLYTAYSSRIENMNLTSH